MANVVAAKEANPDMDFSINSKLSRKILFCWKIPGGFKREARPTEKTLVSRLIDRPVDLYFIKTLKMDRLLVLYYRTTKKMIQI